MHSRDSIPLPVEAPDGDPSLVRGHYDATPRGSKIALRHRVIVVLRAAATFPRCAAGDACSSAFGRHGWTGSYGLPALRVAPEGRAFDVWCQWPGMLCGPSYDGGSHSHDRWMGGRQYVLFVTACSAMPFGLFPFVSSPPRDAFRIPQNPVAPDSPRFVPRLDTAQLVPTPVLDPSISSGTIPVPLVAVFVPYAVSASVSIPITTGIPFVLALVPTLAPHAKLFPRLDTLQRRPTAIRPPPPLELLVVRRLPRASGACFEPGRAGGGCVSS